MRRKGGLILQLDSRLLAISLLHCFLAKSFMSRCEKGLFFPPAGENLWIFTDRSRIKAYQCQPLHWPLNQNTKMVAQEEEQVAQ